MKQLDIRKYIFDIDEACELLLRFTAGKTFSDYSTDPMLRSAVERQFEIIGEALVQALRLDPSLSSRITNPGRIIAFRNRLIHGYSSVADDIVWGIVQANLPTLRNKAATLMEELNNV
jgi:uncharacterized protein with HEPN domain